MKAVDINVKLIDSYFGLLKSLSSETKLALIAKLSGSIKASKKNDNDSLDALYGAFISNETADELITEIKTARTFNRNRIKL